MNTEHSRLLQHVLDLAFSGDPVYAPAALRLFLQEGRDWPRVNSELPAGPHTWRQLLEAASAALYRFGLVDDNLFDRLIAQAPAAARSVEDVRSELLHPERLPPKWQAIGPTGGSVERIAVDPHDQRRLLCCIHIRVKGKGAQSRLSLFRSMDRGASWNPVTIENTSGLLVRWIEFDPHRPGRVFLGTDAGLWTSEDHGDTWSRDPACAPDLPVWQVRLHPFHEDAQFIGTGHDWFEGGFSAGAAIAAGATRAAPAAGEEIAVARTNGRAPGWFQFFDREADVWTSIDLDRPHRAACYAPRDWRRVWIAAGRRLVRSDDKCRTFRLMGSTGKSHVWDIAADPQDSDLVLVAADGGIYRSSDGGLTFDRTSDAGFVRQLALSADGWYAASSRGPLCSKDRGATWQPVGNGFPDQRCWSLTRAADGTLYGGADGGGVYRLDVGSDTWIARSSGLLSLPVLRPAVASPASIAAVNELGLNATRDGGKSWDRIGPGGLSVASADANFVQMAVGGSGYVRLSRDAGESWLPANEIRGSVFWVRIQDRGLWARTDRGQLWRLEHDFSWIDDGPPSDNKGKGQLTDVVIGADGAWTAIDICGNLYRKRATGEPWEQIEEGPATLPWKPATWRLAQTQLGWFAWRYENGLCAAPRLGEPWAEVRLPDGVSAIGGLCDDPRGVAAAWAAALDGRLFRVSAAGHQWQWQQCADQWSTGVCGYLDVLPPSALLASGTGGLYAFSPRYV